MRLLTTREARHASSDTDRSRNETTVSSLQLLTEVELAVLAGTNLPQLEAEILACMRTRRARVVRARLIQRQRSHRAPI
jgi:hypothetical protein